MDEYPLHARTYEATHTDTTGLRVHMTVTVPSSATFGDSTDECGEFAEMAVRQAMKNIHKSRKTEQERCPF